MLRINPKPMDPEDLHCLFETANSTRTKVNVDTEHLEQLTVSKWVTLRIFFPRQCHEERLVVCPQAVMGPVNIIGGVVDSNEFESDNLVRV